MVQTMLIRTCFQYVICPCISFFFCSFFWSFFLIFYGYWQNNEHTNTFTTKPMSSVFIDTMTPLMMSVSCLFLCLYIFFSFFIRRFFLILFHIYFIFCVKFIRFIYVLNYDMNYLRVCTYFDIDVNSFMLLTADSYSSSFFSWFFARIYTKRIVKLK